MANQGSVLGQIGESFEQIGHDVVKQSVQAPKDMVGATLESLGLSQGKKAGNQKTSQTNSALQTPEQKQEALHSEELKRIVARAALEEISGKNKQTQKEPGVWERIQKEEEQKKEMQKKQKEEAAKKTLPQSVSKRPRGDLYGKKAKQTGIENKSKRQD